MLTLTTNQVRAALLLCVLAAAGWTARLYLAEAQSSHPAPFEPYPAGRAAMAATDSIRAWLESPVAVNSADTTELQRLHGIGPELARRIAGERKRGGAYSSLDELARRVPGIGPATADALAGKISFDPPERNGDGNGQ